jgi:hypothetical protein
LSRRWHHDSEYGDGPRRPLTREERAQWRGRITWLFHLGQITRACRDIGHAMADFLGADGRLDPSHDAIVRRADTCPRTVRTALAKLRELGALRWVRRLIRTPEGARQTSNGYALHLPEPDGNPCRETRKLGSTLMPKTAMRAAQIVMKEAVASLRPDRDALAAVRGRREKALGLR